jgi:hypothetical protein
VIGLLAIVALLVSPMTAAEDGSACGYGGTSAMAAMDMPTMAGAAHADAQIASGDPCCDHSAQDKLNDKSRAQMCATSCALASAVSTSPVSFTLVYSRAPVTPARRVAVYLYWPSGPERPPKSIA